jgi:hypothetical protein
MGLGLQILILLLVGLVYTIILFVGMFIVFIILMVLIDLIDRITRNCKLRRYAIIALKTIGYTTLVMFFLITFGIAGLEQIANIVR